MTLIPSLAALLLLHFVNESAAAPLLKIMARDGDQLEFSADNLVGVDVSAEADGMPPAVRIKFDEGSARSFGEFTARHVNQPVAFIICGELIIEPVVQTPILGGSVMIAAESDDVARALATRLASGACS